VRRAPLAVTLLLALAASAAAATSQPVAGHSDAVWMARWWQRYLTLPIQATDCGTGQRGSAVWLEGGTSGGIGNPPPCQLPAGRFVVVDVVTRICSTAQAPPFHADTARSLKACARKSFPAHAKLTATLDGTPVAVHSTASPVFSFTLKRRNLLHGKPGRGRGAAFGYSLILQPLGAGTHTLHLEVTHWRYRQVTYTFDVT
jgi:hypothetical protein